MHVCNICMAELMMYGRYKAIIFQLKINKNLKKKAYVHLKKIIGGE